MKHISKLIAFSQMFRPSMTKDLSHRNVMRPKLIWRNRRTKSPDQRALFGAARPAKIEQHFHILHRSYKSSQHDHFTKINHIHPAYNSSLMLTQLDRSLPLHAQKSSDLSQIPNLKRSKSTATNILNERWALSSNIVTYMIAKTARPNKVKSTRTATMGNLTTLSTIKRQALPQELLDGDVRTGWSTPHNRIAEHQKFNQSKRRRSEQRRSSSPLIGTVFRRHVDARTTNNARRLQPVEFIYRNAVNANLTTPSNFEGQSTFEEHPSDNFSQTTRSVAALKTQNSSNSGAGRINQSETVAAHENVVRKMLATKSVTDQLADRVMLRIEQKMKIDRQRRGL
jgi:hypothetical protein